MPGSFTQLHVQIVFAVKYREALIDNLWKEDLHRYITKIVQSNRHKMLRINSMPDHLHLFIGYQTGQLLPDLIRMIKCESSKWINEKKFTRRLFRWQEGYGAFSYSRSQVKAVAAYIENQEQHHKKINFNGEYLQMLNAFEIPYDPKYLFQPPE
jgi:putative transposase